MGEHFARRRLLFGDFSELAQLHLDRILAKQGEKRIQIASAEGKPFTKGSAVANTASRVGDSYTYRELDLNTKAERRRFTSTVTGITDTEVAFDSGLITDLLGNEVRTRDGRRYTPRQIYPLDYALGKRWVTKFQITTNFGTGLMEMECHIAARESVTVPAGTFDAFRLEYRGVVVGTSADGPVNSELKRWMAPDKVRRPVAVEDSRRTSRSVLQATRAELVAFKQS